MRGGNGMMILVTGGAGRMGRRLCAGLALRGDTVRILCLPGDPAVAVLGGAGFDFAFGDVTRKESLAAALHGVDIVFHLAAVLLAPGHEEVFQAVNADGTRNLAEAAEAAGVSQFIYVSSISVMYPKSNAYARSKLRGETWVKSSRLKSFTIVRPSLAYQDGGAEEFMRFVDHLKRGPLVFLPGGGRARKSPVHVDDLAAAFLALPGNPKAHGKTYLLTGGETLTLRQMAQALLAHMGRPKPILGIPNWLCLMGVAILSAWSRISGSKNPFTLQTYTGLIQDAAPEEDLARLDLGYHPRNFRQGLETLVSLRDCLRAGGGRRVADKVADTGIPAS